ncbi:unnamed protein product [Parnassius apollo]|uniref:(apollo) hypothetical protein n=1 Tax=Parnassius apollo TaxID=110799 RepID=A0A8S3WMD0_PARAO|nr:unnamed protein product [Parnassius apollo]
MSESQASTSRKRKYQRDQNTQPIPVEILEDAVRDLIEGEETDSDYSQYDDSEADPHYILEEGKETDSEQSKIETEVISDMSLLNFCYNCANSKWQQSNSCCFTTTHGATGARDKNTVSTTMVHKQV